jgi:alpha-aminoadipate carrier protein LysW
VHGSFYYSQGTFAYAPGPYRYNVAIVGDLKPASSAGYRRKSNSPGGIQMVTCPKCQGIIDVDEEDVDEGDTISCDECGAALKVIGTAPLELESADDADEDDEDEDGSDEDWK